MPFLSRTISNKKEVKLLLDVFHKFVGKPYNFFYAFQRHIKNLQQLAQLPADDRRALLKSIPDEQYADIMKVLGNMPYIDFQVRCEGMMGFFFSKNVKLYNFSLNFSN